MVKKKLLKPLEKEVIVKRVIYTLQQSKVIIGNAKWEAKSGKVYTFS